MNGNKVIGYLSTVFFTLITAFVAYKVFTQPEFFTFRVMNMWFGYVLLMLGLQGIRLKNSHIADIKLECWTYDEAYDRQYWSDENMQMAYFIPFIQDVVSRPQITNLINQGIQGYEESDYATPTSYKIARILHKLFLKELSSIIILTGIIVIPKLTNDYDLYRGLTYEQLIMITVGLGVVFYNIFASIQNYVIYGIIDETVTVPNSNIYSLVMASMVFIAIGILVLVLLSVITGILNVYPTVFQFLFNFELIGVYILISPALLLLATVILSNQVGRFNIHLDQELR